MLVFLDLENFNRSENSDKPESLPIIEHRQCLDCIMKGIEWGFCNSCGTEYGHARRRGGYDDAAILNRWKNRARARSQRLVRRGVIAKRPCEKCGRANAQIHHEDYHRPEMVSWLCSGCHAKLHRSRRRATSA